MKTLAILMKKFAIGFEKYGQQRVRNELLAMSDRQLTDLGYSRELLRQGVDYWPWRLEKAVVHSQARKFTTTVASTQSSANQEKAA